MNKESKRIVASGNNNTSQDNSRRTITILGSTGSIGKNTLDLLSRYPSKYNVQFLTAQSNVKLLAAQAKNIGASGAVIGNPDLYIELKELLEGTNISVAAGPEALIDAAESPSDFVMAAIVGAAGLSPTMAAIKRGATIGLANKECLVCAGALMIAEVASSGATLLPVDSEHNAIFQVFDFERPESIEKIILTASGGPFRNASKKVMDSATPAEAIAHPNWNMGAKISVDSATMMNKGLEIIEAYHLFPVSSEQIEVLVHPQSVVHSMVAFIDGSVLAQLGSPDMRTPIAYSLAWPDRLSSPAPRLDLAKFAKLDFEAPDNTRFASLGLAKEALVSGGASPIVLNASNEIAVEAFLKGKIRLTDIARIVESQIRKSMFSTVNSISDVLDVDRESRIYAKEYIDKYTAKQ